MTSIARRLSLITRCLPAVLERFGPLGHLWQRPAERTSDAPGESIAWVLAALDSGYSGLVGVSREGYRLLRPVELFPA
jgi:hypothetical protein